MKSSVRKWLVSMNQSSFGYLIYFQHKFFDRAREQICMKPNHRDHICKKCWFFWFYSFLFKKNHVFKEDNSSEKVVIVEEDLHGIDTDDTGNSEDSLRLVFIAEEWEFQPS